MNTYNCSCRHNQSIAASNSFLLNHILNGISFFVCIILYFVFVECFSQVDYIMEFYPSVRKEMEMEIMEIKEEKGVKEEKVKEEKGVKEEKEKVKEGEQIVIVSPTTKHLIIKIE